MGDGKRAILLRTNHFSGCKGQTLQSGMTMTDKQKLLERALGSDDPEIVKTIVEKIGNTTVKDIGRTRYGYELFMTQGFTGDELDDLQKIFNFSEIGIYGDAAIDDEVFFHSIVQVKE